MANYVNRASGKLFHAKSRDKTHVLICQLAHACTHMHVQIHMYTHKPRMHMYTQNIRHATTNHACTQMCINMYTHTWTHTCAHTHTILLKHTCSELLADKRTKQCDILTMFPPHHRFYLILILVFFSSKYLFSGPKTGRRFGQRRKKETFSGKQSRRPTRKLTATSYSRCSTEAASLQIFQHSKTFYFISASLQCPTRRKRTPGGRVPPQTPLKRYSFFIITS